MLKMLLTIYVGGWAILHCYPKGRMEFLTLRRDTDPAVSLYRVKPRDTLSAIAEHAGTSLESINKANPAAAAKPTRLAVNSIIVIPIAKTLTSRVPMANQVGNIKASAVQASAKGKLPALSILFYAVVVLYWALRFLPRATPVRETPLASIVLARRRQIDALDKLDFVSDDQALFSRGRVV